MCCRGCKRPSWTATSCCCCGARWMRRARAAPGSTPRRPPQPSCARSATCCSISTASTHGKAGPARNRCAACSTLLPQSAPPRPPPGGHSGARIKKHCSRPARPRPVGSKSVSACSGKSAKSTNWRQRLSHAQALVDGADGAVRSLQDDETGALAGLARAHALLQAQEHIEPEFANLAEILSSSLAQASDVLRSLQSYLRRAPLDPQRLAALDARMSLWMGLARRYKRPPAQLPALLDDWKAQLRQLDSVTDLDPLQAAQAASAKAYQAAARALSVARAKAAPRLSTAITRAMQGLGMEGGKFEVAVSKAQEPAAHGI